MPRARRAWSAIKADIRRIIREETASLSFWDDTLVLQVFNECKDARDMQLADVHEGWVTTRHLADLVAGQKEYTLPEGAGRIKRILLGFDNHETPLTRDESFSDPVYTAASVATGSGYQPTARLVANVIYLEPPPATARTNGLIIELEGATARLTGDGSKLDLAYPDFMETLLILDTVVALFEIEVSRFGENSAGQRWVSWVDRRRDFYAALFQQFIETRFYGRTQSRGFHLGG